MQQKSEKPFKYLLEATEEYHKRTSVSTASLWTEEAILDFSGLQWHNLNFTARLLLPLIMKKSEGEFKHWKRKQ